MLRHIDISNMLIIDRLELNFQPGLNVLTGETGAGKSILLDALGFVLGWRGRADLVRQGARQGEVVAVFELGPGHPARAVLEDAGLPIEDDLILRRVNSGDGRKTAWINDRRASGETLRALSDTLVELHGQHDDRGLLNPRGHRQILDAFGDLGARIAAVRQAWSERRNASDALDTAKAGLADLRAEEDFLRHACDELLALDPQPGEEAELDAKRRLMQGAERVRADVSKAHQALSQEGAEGAMTDALRWLEGVSDAANATLDAPLAALGRALVELDEAMDGIVAALDALQFNPMELETTEERLFALRGLARKHGVAPDALAALAEDLQARLEALDAGDANLTQLEADLAASHARYKDAADALTEARLSAGARLDTAVMAELAPLKMERAEFATKVTPSEPGPDGQDAVVFTVATNPGAPAGALNKIASGGELSRFFSHSRFA